MNEIDKYKSMFSQIHSDVKIDTEGMMKMKPKRAVSKQIIVIVVTLCIVAAFSFTVFAANLFGLQDLILNRQESDEKVKQTDDNTYNSEVNGNEGNKGNDDINGNKGNDGSNSSEGSDNTEPSPQGLEVMQLISLQGYANSNEFKAAAEWLAFTENYDTDGAILSAVGNGPTGLDAKYDLYLVYSQEMADKLDEILTKYGLKLHSEWLDFYSEDELIAAVANGNFLGENKLASGYMYEDGTFQFDSQTSPGIWYQFMGYKKGSFTEAMLNIGDVNDYEQWQYNTACGLTANLSVSPYKSLVIVELDATFITINVLAGSDDGITKTDLETMADSFDFSLLK